MTDQIDLDKLDRALHGALADMGLPAARYVLLIAEGNRCNAFSDIAQREVIVRMIAGALENLSDEPIFPETVGHA